MSKRIPLHRTELNRNHTLRYVGARLHAPMNGNTKPVIPVYRRLHETDESVEGASRARHDGQPDERKLQVRSKDNSNLIQDRPLG